MSPLLCLGVWLLAGLGVGWALGRLLRGADAAARAAQRMAQGKGGDWPDGGR